VSFKLYLVDPRIIIIDDELQISQAPQILQLPQIPQPPQILQLPQIPQPPQILQLPQIPQGKHYIKYRKQ